MEVFFTSSARMQLLETVVRLRDRDRERAESLIDGVEERLRAVAADVEEIRELDLEGSVARKDGGHRLIYRVRNEVVWVVAVI